MQRMNKELERRDDEDVVLNEKELAKLQKTAYVIPDPLDHSSEVRFALIAIGTAREVEGIDLAAARQLQKGYRYII